MNRDKTLKFIRIKCRACGHLNLIPVIKRFRLYEIIKCEKCGKVIAESKELVRIRKALRK
jgi:ribosomal protein S27E